MTEEPADAVHPEFGCPRCGETAVDSLVWLDDATVRCSQCGAEYQPGRPSAADSANGTAAP